MTGSLSESQLQIRNDTIEVALRAAREEALKSRRDKQSSLLDNKLKARKAWARCGTKLRYTRQALKTYQARKRVEWLNYDIALAQLSSQASAESTLRSAIARIHKDSLDLREALEKSKYGKHKELVNQYLEEV